MSERDPWLTEKEAAKELRVSAYTVRLEREAGRLGFAKLRRRVFYPMSQINAYRASITCPATSNSGSTRTADAGISHGPSGAARSAHQLAQRIVSRRSGSARLSS
jgi:hypothetical protein